MTDNSKVPDIDETLRCPADLESSDGHWDRAGYPPDESQSGEWDCACCGAPYSWHKKVPA